MPQAPTREQRSARTESGKRQALEGAQAGNAGEAAAEEAASDAGAASSRGEGLVAVVATATGWEGTVTCGEGPSAPVSPAGTLLTTSTRARVMKPGAAKQARAPPRYTTYAVAVLRASGHEAVAEGD